MADGRLGWRAARHDADPSAAAAEGIGPGAGPPAAAIIAAFLLGLFYLTQTLGTAMTRFDIESLAAQRADIEQRILSVEGDIARWGAEPAIVHGAQQAGMDSLGTSLRVPGR